jgi:excinuclease UvrABC ATPase subunit
MTKPSRAVVLIEHNLEVVKIADWALNEQGKLLA